MAQTRRQHKPRSTGPLPDPQAERVVRELYQGLPAGVTQTITFTVDGHTHKQTFKNGVLVGYEVT